VDDKIRHTIEAKKRCECYCIPKDEMRAAFASLPDVWFMMKHKAISEAIAFEQSLDDIDDERISELHNLLDEVSCIGLILPTYSEHRLVLGGAHQGSHAWGSRAGGDSGVHMQAEIRLRESKMDFDDSETKPNAPGDSAANSPDGLSSPSKVGTEELVPFKDANADRGPAAEDATAVLASIEQHLADQASLIADLCERATKVKKLQGRLATLEKRAESVADGVDAFRKELRDFLGMPAGMLSGTVTAATDGTVG
jgi:hypothetical protein